MDNGNSSRVFCGVLQSGTQRNGDVIDWASLFADGLKLEGSDMNDHKNVDVGNGANTMIRVQRRRTKGWRMPANTIYVGRPSKLGNPYKPGEHGTAEECKELYCQLVFSDHALRKMIELEATGKNVACWCKLGDPCHGDVVLDFARPFVVRLTEAVIDEQKRRVASADLPHTWHSTSFIPLRDWLTDSLENWKLLPQALPYPSLDDNMGMLRFLRNTHRMDVIEAALRIENKKLTFNLLDKLIVLLGIHPLGTSPGEGQATAVELRNDEIWFSDAAKAMIGDEAELVSFGG